MSVDDGDALGYAQLVANLLQIPPFRDDNIPLQVFS